MLGSVDLTFEEPLRTGIAYRVEGSITDAQRKTGRRAGVFDIVTYRLELRREGRLAASCDQTLILPRRA